MRKAIRYHNQHHNKNSCSARTHTPGDQRALLHLAVLERNVEREIVELVHLLLVLVLKAHLAVALVAHVLLQRRHRREARAPASVAIDAHAAESDLVAEVLRRALTKKRPSLDRANILTRG